MALPFNPMSFVTPYTAVGTASKGAGANLANIANAARNTKVQEGYLANTQRRTDIDEQRFGQAEMDKARAQLDAAMLSGNSDMAEAALNNLKTIAERNGLTLAETRSDAALNTGVTDKLGEQKLLPGSAGKIAPGEVGSEETPLDVDAYDAANVTDGSSDRVNTEADSRIDAELAREPNPFTGGVPGGSLPQVAAGATAGAPPIRTPGGSLPPSETAEAKQAPLRGYTLIGRDGKPLYTVAPKDVELRQRGRVGEVFSSLAGKTQDGQEKQWLAQAQAMAEKAVGTMPIDEAVKTGLEFYVGRMKARDSLSVVEANRKPRFGTGVGGGFRAMGKTQDTAESIKGYITEARGQLSKINGSDGMLSQAEALAQSSDPALQRNAIDLLVQSRSGAAVAVSERARYDQLEGVIPQLKNYAARFTGGELDPGYVQMLRQVIRTQREINNATREELAADLEEAYSAQNEGKVDAPILERRKKALGKTIRRNDAPPVPADEEDPGAGFY